MTSPVDTMRENARLVRQRAEETSRELEEGARVIRGLKDEARILRTALEGIAEFCSGDDHTLGAIERLATVRNTAERALSAGKSQ